MQEQEIVLNEYEYIAVTDTVYHPRVRGGKWYLISDQYCLSFEKIVEIFDIPEDEQIIIKLKYGG